MAPNVPTTLRRLRRVAALGINRHRKAGIQTEDPLQVGRGKLHGLRASIVEEDSLEKANGLVGLQGAPSLKRSVAPFKEAEDEKTPLGKPLVTYTPNCLTEGSIYSTEFGVAFGKSGRNIHPRHLRKLTWNLKMDQTGRRCSSTIQ